MKLNAYCIYDNKALVYHPPFFSAQDGAAVRIFSDVVTDPNTSIGRHPLDYSLWFCGTYDDQLGLFIAQTPLRHISDAQALLPVAQPSLSFPLDTKE